MKKVSILSILVLSFFSACVHDPLAPEVQYICDQGGVDYKAEIEPLLSISCGSKGCHGQGDSRGGVSVESYKGVEKIVRRYNLNKSDLWEVINASGEGRMPPPPAAPLNKEQLDLIERWIMEGAQETDCGKVICSYTATPSFSMDILPIAESQCAGSCHAGSSPSGGFGLTTKEEWITAIQEKGLLDALTGSNGYNQMPPTGAMDSCSIHQIELWNSTGRQD